MPSRRAALDLPHAAPYDITLTPKRRHRYGKAEQNSHVRLCKPFMRLRKPVMHKPCVEVNRLANPSESLVQVYGFSTIFRIPPRRTAVLHGWDGPYSGLNMRRLGSSHLEAMGALPPRSCSLPFPQFHDSMQLHPVVLQKPSFSWETSLQLRGSSPFRKAFLSRALD
jgi:hypothetical protein